MKKIIYITIAALCIVSGGCKKLVDEKPLSDGTYDNFFKNRFDAEAGIAGMYGGFQQAMIGEKAFANRLTYWGEGRSDNFERFKTYANNNSNEMHFNTLTPNNDWSDWSPLYTVIGRANLLIQKLPLINNYTQAGTANELPAASLQSYMAQCYAMRAICYFYIARVWGDAPIRTQPYLSIYDDPELAREPVTKVLDQVISDLNTAYTTIAKGATPNAFYIGEGAICATMADVYMWKKDYPNAILWLKRLFAAKAPTGKVYNAAGTATTGTGGAAADLQPGAICRHTQSAFKEGQVQTDVFGQGIFPFDGRVSERAAQGRTCNTAITFITNFNSLYRLVIPAGIISHCTVTCPQLRIVQKFFGPAHKFFIRKSPCR